MVEGTSNKVRSVQSADSIASPNREAEQIHLRVALEETSGTSDDFLGSTTGAATACIASMFLRPRTSDAPECMQ